MPPLVFQIPGKPVAWSRARIDFKKRRVFNSDQLRSFESLVKFTAAQELAGRPPFDGPVVLHVRVQVAPARRSWSQRRVADALTGVTMPTSKPDLSNIAKAIEDALNGIAYRDDAQVVRLLVEKRYAPEEVTIVDVREWTPAREAISP